jgi:hypothetical protein
MQSVLDILYAFVFRRSLETHKENVSFLSLLFVTQKCHVIKQESILCVPHFRFFFHKQSLLLFINTSFLLIMKEKSE